MTSPQQDTNLTEKAAPDDGKQTSSFSFAIFSAFLRPIPILHPCESVISVVQFFTTPRVGYAMIPVMISPATSVRLSFRP